MKRRVGFVSNSSSTSFLIYGVELEKEEVDEIVEQYSTLELKNMLYNSDNISDMIKSRLDDNLDNDSSFDNIEILERIIFPDMDVIIRDDYDTIIYVGGSPEYMKDDETKGEWKNKIESRLKYQGIERSVGWLEDCWRDG